jgi:Icc protein
MEVAVVRLVQLSDCHLPASPGTPYRGIDPYPNFERVLARIADWTPDAILATGDLSEDASESAYAWLADRLQSLDVPMFALPGNHDVPELMRSSFPATAVDAPLVREAGNWRLVLLNSIIPGQVPGRLEGAQLEALDRVLAESDRPTLIALHHQPVPMGSPWIDRYPLLNPADFWAVLDRHTRVRAVCWGHVHQAYDTERNGVRLLACPSSASNSLPGSERFTPDPSGPACRWLVLGENGSLDTGLMFGS